MPPVIDVDTKDLPADVALQVCHIGRWRLFCASYRGLQHVEQKLPRQDAYAVSNKDGEINIAVADGLGSESLSHLGARLACDRGVEVLSQRQPRGESDFSAIYGEIQQDFFNYARQQKIEAREFATTLQLLRIDDQGFWYGRLGDGGCVLLERQGATWLGGLDRSSLGVSNLSDPKALSRLECDAIQADGVIGFLIFSDGVEDIFLDAGKQGPEEKNVRRMVDLVKEKNLEQLLSLFNRFLSSDGDRDLKDDKTIIAGALDTHWGPELALPPAAAVGGAVKRSVRPRGTAAEPSEPGETSAPLQGNRPPLRMADFNWPEPSGTAAMPWLTTRRVVAALVVVAALLLWGMATLTFWDWINGKCLWFVHSCREVNVAPPASLEPRPHPASAHSDAAPPPGISAQPQSDVAAPSMAPIPPPTPATPTPPAPPAATLPDGPSAISKGTPPSKTAPSGATTPTPPSAGTTPATPPAATAPGAPPNGNEPGAK